MKKRMRSIIHPVDTMVVMADITHPMDMDMGAIIVLLIMLLTTTEANNKTKKNQKKDRTKWVITK